MRKTSTALGILGAVLAVLIITGVSAQGPAPATLSGPDGQIQASGDTINFQGRLLDSASDPAAAGTYSMRFTICTSPTDQTSCSGSAVWSGAYSVDVVAGGLFNVLLTGIDADDLTAATTYLMAEVWTGSAWDWMDPNQQITSVAIAIGNIRKNLPDTTTAGTAGYLLTVSNTGTGSGLAASGAVVGLYGESTATNGAGVEGYNAANIGVYGESDTGEGVHGYATVSSGDVFGVVGHAQSTTYYVPPSGASAGVVGSVATADDYGVFGINPNTSGRAFGVVGLAASTTVNEPSGTNTAVGVLGSAERGTDYGVYGHNSAAASGYGILGISDGTTSGGFPSAGVVGHNSSVTSQGFGVIGAVGSGVGVPAAPTSAGVAGSTSFAEDYGVYGVNTFTGVGGYGVFGRANGSNNGSGTTSAGVIGVNYNANYAFGVIGAASGSGWSYPTDRSAGVLGSVTLDSDYGVVGINTYASGGGGVYGSGYLGVLGEGVAGVYGYGSYGVYGEALGGSTSNYGLYSYGNTAATGSKSAIVLTQHHGWRHLYSMESPDVLFEDVGTAQLEGGSATVTFDPVFAETINLDQPYQVFLTPQGDCGLYVADKTRTSFTVQALDNKRCAIAFDYRIVAKRLGFEDVRLAEAEDPAVTIGRAGIELATAQVPGDSVLSLTPGELVVRLARTQSVQPGGANQGLPAGGPR